MKNVFLYTIILGIIAHGYCFLNLAVSHDSLAEFFQSGRWAKAYLGRIFYAPYIVLFRGRINLPWIIGILAIVWIAFAVYLVIRIFDIKETNLIILVSGIFVCNPTVYALSATYTHDLDADMFAMFLAVVATWLWNCEADKWNLKKKIIKLLVSALILAVSMGIYQSYLGVTIALIIIVCINDLLNGNDYLKVLYKGITGIVMVIVSALLYLLMLKLFTNVTGISVLDSQSYNSVGNILSLLEGGGVERIYNTYVKFVEAFKTMITLSDIESIVLIIHLLLMSVIFYVVIWRMFQIKWQNSILVAILLAIMPFGMNIAIFLNDGYSHILMQYAAWMTYIFVLILIKNFKEEKYDYFINRIIYIGVIILLFIIISENIQIANTVYVKKNLEYQATLSYMTRVLEEIEEQEEYVVAETRVMFVGEDVEGFERYGFEDYKILTGAGPNLSITYYGTYENYFEYILGTPILVYKDSELLNDKRVKEMPIFPSDGSIKMIDEVLVVKLKETSLN